MKRIFDVVDDLDISRELIQVELLADGDGAVDRLGNGKVRIVLPATTDLSSWLETLAATLRSMDLGPDADRS